MGSPIIGRTDCPECGFKAAHVKQSERCLFRFCPECGSQYHARTKAQQEALRAKMRPVEDQPQAKPPAPAAAPAAAAPAAPPKTTAPAATPAPSTKQPKAAPAMASAGRFDL